MCSYKNINQTGIWFVKEEILYIVLFTIFTGVLVDPVYKLTPIFEPKNKFSYFWVRLFLKKLIFYLGIFFQVHYGFTKNLS